MCMCAVRDAPALPVGPAVGTRRKPAIRLTPADPAVDAVALRGTPRTPAALVTGTTCAVPLCPLTQACARAAVVAGICAVTGERGHPCAPTAVVGGVGAEPGAAV